MNHTASQPTSRDQGWSARILAVAVAVGLIVASLLTSLRPVAAQMEFDFNGDGEIQCDDFREEFPETFTDEATAALQQYPDELSDLNNDPKEDDIACEGQSGDAESGDGPARAADAESGDGPARAADDASTPQPTSTPAPAAPAAPSAPAADATESTDIPADVMARVEGCAVIAISSRGVSGAGCPGVGTVTFRIPDDAPPMKGTVITNPGAALQQVQSAPSPSNSGGGSPAKSDEESSAGKSDRGGKSSKAQKTDSDESGKANKTKNSNKNSDTSRKDNKKDKTGKNDKNKNDKHKGKKSKKHGKKGK